MERTAFPGLFRVALFAVLANLALVAGLGLSLTGDARVFLPIVALMLPLLTAAALEAVARRVRSRAPSTESHSHSRQLPVFSSLKQAV